MKVIKLAYKRPNISVMSISKANPPEAEEDAEEEESDHYPEAYLHEVSPEMMQMPDTGEVTFNYRVTGRSESEHEGKKHCSITLELHDAKFEPKANKQIGEYEKTEKRVETFFNKKDKAKSEEEQEEEY
jgi:hypothetical protein